MTTQSEMTNRPVGQVKVRGDRPYADITAWVLRDPQLAAQCSAAVDALEVAARLETHGVSSRVAIDSFGYPDVFTAAEAVYASLPFVDVDPPTSTSVVMGGPVDLLRGALYALPALFLPVVVTGFALHVRWWVLPVGLTVAWGAGQASATVAWSLRGRGDERSDSLVAFTSVMACALLCLGCAVLAVRLLGGNETSTVLAVAIAAYIAASGMLVFQRAEWMLAVCMVPAVVGSVLALGLLPVSITHRAASWCVVATAALVVVVANRHLLARRWRRPTLVRADRARAVRFFAYGLGCGLFISVFIGFAAQLDGSGGALVIAVCPLLATLGLMEWQLRSFRSRATSALATSPDLRRFGGRVRSAFVRSVGLYVVTLALLSVAGVEIGYARDASYVPILLACVGALGIAFFLALLLATSGRVDLVLASWAASFTVLAGLLSAAYVDHRHIAPLTGLDALLAASGTAILLLSLLSSRVLISPLSY